MTSVAPESASPSRPAALCARARMGTRGLRVRTPRTTSWARSISGSATTTSDARPDPASPRMRGSAASPNRHGTPRERRPRTMSGSRSMTTKRMPKVSSASPTALPTRPKPQSTTCSATARSTPVGACRSSTPRSRATQPGTVRTSARCSDGDKEAERVACRSRRHVPGLRAAHQEEGELADLVSPTPTTARSRSCGKARTTRVTAPAPPR